MTTNEGMSIMKKNTINENWAPGQNATNPSTIPGANPTGRAYGRRQDAEKYLRRVWTCDPEDFEGDVVEQPDGTFQAFVRAIPLD